MDDQSSPSHEESQCIPQNGINRTSKPPFKPVSSFRRILPQVLASVSQNLLIVDLAIAMNLSTIVIPALTGVRNRDAAETLTFTDSQASWFASIAFICQPLGSILSGVIVEKLGRKLTMIIVNIPHIIAYIMLFYAKNVETMFIAAVLLGLGVGFMEAPVITYVGEISQPSIRGVLVAIAQIAYAIGCAILYSIGAVATWRTTVIILCVLPVITMICISLIVETPLWLLSKGREKDAIRSLQWLRGWVPAVYVEKEMFELKRYNESSHSCVPCQKQQLKCMHPRATILQKTKELLRQKTRRPFFIIMLLFFFAVFTPVAAMRPYFIQIFEKYNLVIDSNLMVVIVGNVGIVSNFLCATCVKVFGKRKTTLASLVGNFICCLCWSLYTWQYLPPDLNSFDKENNLSGEKTYVTIILFLGLQTFSCIGIFSTPWIFVGEIYPNKTRGMACGFTAALTYIFTFTSLKMYYTLETTLSLAGIELFYAIISFIGIILVYLFVPETEGRTLEEIEEHFSNKHLRLTDRHIVSQNLLRKQQRNIQKEYEI